MDKESPIKKCRFGNGSGKRESLVSVSASNSEDDEKVDNEGKVEQENQPSYSRKVISNLSEWARMSRIERQKWMKGG